MASASEQVTTFKLGISSERGTASERNRTEAAARQALEGLVDDGTVQMGVDIVQVERIRRVIKRSPAFVKRVFTQGERDYCDGATAPEYHYATRFAAKEAVVKALGTGFSNGIKPCDVEVTLTSKGRPVVKLHGAAARRARELGVLELPISLSYTHIEAVACAMAITENSVSAARRRVDPAVELSKRFKEARGLLDELETPQNPVQETLPGIH
jgi:holo-[acyl-carrier protein] synthase